MVRWFAPLLCLGLLVTGAPPAGAVSDEAPAPEEQQEEDEARTEETDIETNFGDRLFELVSRDGMYALRFAAAIQGRYSYVAYDDAVEGNQTDYSNFYLRRARLWFMGHAFDPRFTYFIHLQLEPTNSVNAHDAWIQYAFTDWLKLGVGRNKISYGLEFLNSGFALSLVDRSIMYGETDIDVGGGLSRFPGGGTARFGLATIQPSGFATGGLCLYRSQGVQLEGMSRRLEGPTFEYQVGIWQGRATRGYSNSDANHLYAVRLGFHPRGWINWRSQGDLAWTDGFRYSILGSAYTHRSQLSEVDQNGYNLAMQTRFRGLAADFEWGVERFELAELPGEEVDREAWRVQVGYFLIPKRLEIVARYAEMQRMEDPTAQRIEATGLGYAEVWEGEDLRTVFEGKITELTAGVGVLFSSNYQHRVLMDASLLGRTFLALDGFPPEEQQDYRVRTMVQFLF